jgi:hypothetical protein
LFNIPYMLYYFLKVAVIGTLSILIVIAIPFFVIFAIAALIMFVVLNPVVRFIKLLRGLRRK